MLFFAAVAEFDGQALSDASKRLLIAALKDPLALYDERSPGMRGPGVLLTIKPPYERVLPSVRERETPPVAETAGFALPPETAVSIPIVPPEYDNPPENRGIAPPPPPFSLFFPPIPPGGGTDTPPTSPPTEPPTSPPPPPPSEPPPPPITIVLPEPAPWMLMIPGIFAVACWRTRKRRPASAP
jgi:hypothetical protein